MKLWQRDPTFGLVVEPTRLGLFFWPESDAVFDYRWHTCEHFETYNLTLFNPTRVAGLIRQFLSEHTVRSCRAVIALEGSCLHEMLLNKQEMSVDPQQGEAISTHQLNGDYWYSVTLSYALRAQYHLLSLAVPLNLVSITTVTMAYWAKWSLGQRCLPESAYQSLAALKESLASSDTTCIQQDRPVYAQGLYVLAQAR
jgi:hypothetical protein